MIARVLAQNTDTTETTDIEIHFIYSIHSYKLNQFKAKIKVKKNVVFISSECKSG